MSPATGLSLVTRNLPPTVQKYPRGYPLQAAFQASESGWSIYCSFNYLHSRVILDLQDELRLLEENLEEIDQDNSQKKRVGSRKDDIMHWRREKEESPRANIIETIRRKLVSYGMWPPLLQLHRVPINTIARRDSFQSSRPEHLPATIQPRLP